MTQRDSNKRFGLIGLALIVVAYLVWAIVLPRFDDKSSDQTIDDITSQPVQRQDAPRQPISDSPVPRPPTE